ncbi:MAG TPA: hypothetical protein VIR33_07595 [Thermopolyspora sp.]|jgi:hypothetical protein
MGRLLLRIFVPARLRHTVRARLDARYVSRADHQALRAEVKALRDEVTRLRKVAAPAVPPASAPDPALAAKAEDAHRLAREGAAAMDHTLQAEVLLWQAVDRLEERIDRLDRPGSESSAEVSPGGFASCV